MPRFSHEPFNQGSNYDELYFEEAEARTAEYKEKAKEKIEELLNEYRIVWATFVEVHLEDEYNWWISRGAFEEMRDEGRITIFRPVGRPSAESLRLPKFYYDSKIRKLDVEKKYEEARSLWLKLVNPSDYSLPDYTKWAEDLVLNMFEDKGGRLIRRPIPKLNGSGGGDNDFLISYKGLHYSIEVKNKFQALDLNTDIRFKFGVARSNDHEFLLVPRFLNPYHAYNEIIAKGGYVLMFKRMAFPPGTEAFVSELEEWGLPASVWDKLPNSVWHRFINDIHPKAAKKRISKIYNGLTDKSFSV